MIDIESQVFTTVATALRTEYGASNIYVAPEYVSQPPRHRYTHGISEQDRCPVWAHLSVRACALAHARWPARQGVGRGALAGVRASPGIA